MISLKSKLKEMKPTIGSWITISHPAIAEIMAKAGFDWLVVDLEHSTITIKECEELIRVIHLCGVVSLVRLSANDPIQIKRVMDAGAHGVVVPMVKNRREAEAAASAVFYPPVGERSVGLARAQGYGTTFEEYREWLSQEGIVIVQVEHIESINNLEDIFSVPGVDGYFIGPYDLSASMGLHGQFAHPDMVAAIERIKQVGLLLGKPGGMHIVEPDVNQLEARIREGFTFIAYSLDTRMLDTACRAGLAVTRRGL